MSHVGSPGGAGLYLILSYGRCDAVFGPTSARRLGLHLERADVAHRSELDIAIQLEAGRLCFGSGDVLLDVDSDVVVSIPRCVQHVVYSIGCVCTELEVDHMWAGVGNSPDEDIDREGFVTAGGRESSTPNDVRVRVAENRRHLLCVAIDAHRDGHDIVEAGGARGDAERTGEIRLARDVDLQARASAAARSCSAAAASHPASSTRAAGPRDTDRLAKFVLLYIEDFAHQIRIRTVFDVGPHRAAPSLALLKHGAVAVLRPNGNAEIGSLCITVVVNTNGPRQLLNAKLIPFAIYLFYKETVFANLDKIRLGDDQTPPLIWESLRDFVFRVATEVATNHCQWNHD